MLRGKLIIECHDSDETAKEYIEGNEKRIDNIFGLQKFPGDTHQFEHNFKRLEKLLGGRKFQGYSVESRRILTLKMNYA